MKKLMTIRQILPRTHLLLVKAICIINILLICAPSFALQCKLTDADNIVADGVVDTDEWTDAGWEADSPGDGAMYAMYRQNYDVGLGSYTGTFQFLLHNIEQLTSDNDWDYNVFDVYEPDDSINAFLRVYVFDNSNNPAGTNEDSWLTASGLKSLIGFTGSDFDDRGFLVYNYDESNYAHWLPENIGPEDGGYVWDNFYGVYAAGGFNNSAYEESLTLAEDNANELYEVIYNSTWGGRDGLGGVRRGIKDPDYDDPDAPLVDYWDGTIPEPATVCILGLGALSLIRRRK